MPLIDQLGIAQDKIWNSLGLASKRIRFYGYEILPRPFIGTPGVNSQQSISTPFSESENQLTFSVTIPKATLAIVFANALADIASNLGTSPGSGDRFALYERAFSLDLDTIPPSLSANAEWEIKVGDRPFTKVYLIGDAKENIARWIFTAARR
jgi:hypothetical protein